MSADAVAKSAPPVAPEPSKSAVEGVRTRVVKLRRRGGRLVQGCDVYIGRACCRGGWTLGKSKWANPFAVSQCGGSAAEAARRYEQWLLTQPELLAAVVPDLRGKVLGCWCKSEAD